jgi:leucyl aminopeptidase
LIPPGTPTNAEFAGVTTPPNAVEVDLLFVPVFEDEGTPLDLTSLEEATGGEVGRARTSAEFRARPYDVFVTPVVRGWKAKRIGVIGAGKSADWDPERMRRVAAASSYAAHDRAVASVGWLVRGPAPATQVARMAADGLTASEFAIGTYRHRTERRRADRVVVIAPGANDAAIAEAVRVGHVVGVSANAARALANEPGNLLTPRVLASRVSSLASSVGLGVEVLDEARIRALGMGLLLGVAQGSAEPPQVIVIRHEPAGVKSGPVLGFVGKGITFDSGGISLKPAEGMDRMKSDMSGAAAVAAAMHALARLSVPVRVVAVIPTAENMPGSRATRPGDVLTGASGKTVEVINTDAEGRLILGDALWYAQQLGATHLVDVATLTGAIVVALGHHTSGLFGTDIAWTSAVQAAAAAAGDRVWPMPIYEEARDQMKSEIADLLNTGGRPGGACTAAAFLKDFAGGLPWAHLDIAGTAWAETKRAYMPKGPTGVAVRALIELALRAAAGASRA